MYILYQLLRCFAVESYAVQVEPIILHLLSGVVDWSLLSKANTATPLPPYTQETLTTDTVL